ncbi:HAD-like domain-containing protein [Cyathus striatus]|nr:HAD-like domain-containing protein [Cyathus striatus]
MSALRNVQVQYPSYTLGPHKWWQEVIRQTAIGAGAEEGAVDKFLPEIVPALFKRFSSKEGYAAYNDAIPTIKYLHEQLSIYTGVISNADFRIRLALKDLGFPATLTPVILSEEAGVEKPSMDIFHACLDIVNKDLLPSHESPIKPEECLHVGDELKCDYKGALDAGMNALLLRRLGQYGEQAHKEPDENLKDVTVISDLSSVIAFTKQIYMGRGSG